MSKKNVSLPPIKMFYGKFGNNELQQWLRGPVRAMQSLGTYRSTDVSGLLLTSDTGERTLVVPTPHTPSVDVDFILVCPKPNRIFDPAEPHFFDSRVHWIKPATEIASPSNLQRVQQAANEAQASWLNQFFFHEERVDATGTVVAIGLRPPQIGAIHAAIGHWRAQDEAATIVMPTGTGKTETMLGLLVAEQIHRLCVVVPNHALRSQIADKFLSLGLLPQLGITGTGIKRPVVLTLFERLAMESEVDRLVMPSNVIVSTAALIAQCPPDIQRRIADHCSHLFIDEAHHVAAKTWYRFRSQFQKKRILQFTATPFRRDGRLVDGRQIFAYPLRKAQAERYFQPLKFIPLDVLPPEAGHRAIAESALRQLNEDLSHGLDHLVMARVSTVPRAQKLVDIYKDAGATDAVLIHSRLTDKQVAMRLALLRTRQSRVAICVDMFGEGFDLPQLKIAALHDVHKSLTTTLQFVGRFTRSAKGVGSATLIVNLADVRVDGALRELYQEDSDWNLLLPGIAERSTRRHRQRTDFINSFKEVPPEIPLLGIEPKMSALIYQTACSEWAPEKAAAWVPPETPCIGPVINAARTVSLYITRENYPVEWGRVASPVDTVYHLYLVHWDQARQLLFINTSNHDHLPEALSKDVSKGTAQLIQGEQVFRALKGVNRLQLMNLGLKHTLNRTTRFTMYVGSDILEGLSDTSQQNRIKTNLFGKGFEGGERTTVGCSLKGRIWSHRVAEDISEWLDWCKGLGTKLIDSTITTEKILKTVIWPTTITTRPELMPIAIEWPDAFILRHDLSLEIEVGGAFAPFFDTQLELQAASERGPLRFSVSSEHRSASYDVILSADGIGFAPAGDTRAFLHFARRGRTPLEDIFQRDPPIIRFHNGAWLEGNRLFPAPSTLTEPFKRDRIEVWDWSGIDLSQESQTSAKAPTSIQFRTIERMKSKALQWEYDVLIDDDGANEVADIVGLKVTPQNELVVHLVHCKYSQESSPGARIEDLYAVCGQAQKSINWRGNIERMLDMLVTRDAARVRRTSVSGIEIGDGQTLRRILRQAHLLIPKMAVWIVQPGLSKSRASTNQLHLLAVTELYLMETYEAPFGVIGST